jgi:hypothetical protein
MTKLIRHSLMDGIFIVCDFGHCDLSIKKRLTSFVFWCLGFVISLDPDVFLVS